MDILDEDGAIVLPVSGGRQFTEAETGSHYENYDFIISIAHFKGHSVAGFGGTFKNLGMGLATSDAKSLVHSGEGEFRTGFASDGDLFLERVAEYTKAVVDDMGENIIYINVLNNLSVDCDCVENAAHPDMEDIGILASLDPVALDQASVDLVYAAPDNQHLVNRIESKDGEYILDYAERIGLGSRTYKLISIDE